VLAGPFTMLLFDEPSSGLDVAETQRFGEVLSTVVRERDAGLLLVEHDMSLVRQICDRVYVLDFGQLIFQGTPGEMLASSAVRDAYLGTEAPSPAGTAAPVPSGGEARRHP
jgi:ABC-type branched-subunit amino acid transport system ATPase component